MKDLINLFQISKIKTDMDKYKGCSVSNTSTKYRKRKINKFCKFTFIIDGTGIVCRRPHCVIMLSKSG